MAAILIYNEKTQLAGELVTAAKLLDQEKDHRIWAVCINDDSQTQELTQKGINVYRITDGDISLSDTEAVASALFQAAKKAEARTVLLASNRRGKELSGRLAQMLEAGCLNDVLAIRLTEGRIECVRNALGGATLATQYIETECQVIALAPKAFEETKEQGNGRIIDLDIETKQSRVRLLETLAKAGDSADLEAAEVLVAVGLGADQEDLKAAETLAKVLGGELGCSKPVATDRKWLSEERLIGLSGKKCKPQLAILLGISGQVQFMVGIREARTIVAINQDENANIMQMADYKMIAKIKDVLPELTARLQGIG